VTQKTNQYVSEPSLRLGPSHTSALIQEKITAEGSNFEGIWEFAGDIIDVDKIFSNDIYAVLCTYGVEMARTIIMHEIQSVFGAYKINVDARHVSLIADYMVRSFYPHSCLS
jgi:hypothetical protein